jgi:hypothetical protein
MIDEIIIKARLDTKQAEQEFDELKKKGNSTISDIEKNEINVKVDTKDAVNQVSNLNGTFGKLRQSLTGSNGIGSAIAGAFGGLAVGAIGSISSAIGSLGSKIVDSTAKFQKFEAVLTNTLGSNSKAKKALDDIVSFASTTPFQVDELTESFIKFANRGIILTSKEMTKLGDIASSQGKSFNELTEAVLDAQTGEFERLKEFGIRASKEGNTVSLSFKGITKEVANNEDAIKNAILSYGDLEGVAGGMEAISKTLGGQLSNLSDNVDMLFKNLGEALAPIISEVTSRLNTLISFIVQALPGVTNFFSQIGGAIITFFSESQYVQKVGELFIALFNTVKEVSIGIYNAFVEIGSAFGLGQDGASNFVKVFDYVLTNVRIAINALILLINNFKDVLVGSLEVIALQVKTFVNFWKAIFAGDFRGAVNVIGNYINGLSFIFENTFGKIKNNLIDFVKGILKIVEPFASMFNIDINKLNKQLDSAKSLIAKKAKGNEQIDANKKDLKTPSGTPPPTLPADPTAPTKGEDKKASEAAAKALKIKKDLEKEKNEAVFKAAQEQQKILDEIENANYKNEFDRERQQIRDEFFLKIQTNKELEAELIKLRDARIADIDKKEKEANNKKLEETYLSEIQSAENFSKQQSLILKNRLANGEITEEQYNEKIKDLELSTLESKILIASKWSGTVKKAAEDITTFTNQEADKRLDKEIENNKKREELLKKAVNELIEFAQNGILLQIGINPADVNKVKSTLEDLQNTLKKEDATPGEKAEAAAKAAGAVAQTVSNTLFAADTQRRQEELAALQAQQEEELRLAGDNEQKKDLIRQKYALKEKDIKRKQAEADKRKAIFDAIINTAVAVVTGFVKGGPILAAIAAALGAAQIALISAQPIPKFAKGGAVPSSDIQGMISGKPHAAGGVLIEAEGNEFITRRSQAMKGDNLGLLEAINMSDSERDAYINRHYVMPALQAKESEAAKSYRSSIIEAENNLIARVSSHTLKSIHREQKNTTDAVKKLSNNKDFSW